MAQAELVFIAGRARITGAAVKPSTTPVVGPARAAHADFRAGLAGHPAPLILVDADSIDFQNPADHRGGLDLCDAAGAMLPTAHATTGGLI